MIKTQCLKCNLWHDAGNLDVVDEQGIASAIVGDRSVLRPDDLEAPWARGCHRLQEILAVLTLIEHALEGLPLGRGANYTKCEPAGVRVFDERLDTAAIRCLRGIRF